ncbi:flagellar hook assembly protein FlgD [Halalkalibacillus halophilus]|uniref:flagellar hook assembly protein FlgD n=1 Tax=Halalkalibacillus halophilus TaxID=392827 RepID=UPI000405E5CF|nr:flagellar hook assembly protein FlgD [Halalkalibacillus halophilus]
MKVDDSLFLANNTQKREGNNELDRDSFLQILMTQLTNQDPLDPMDDKDFVAQMATFSQLEQTMNMSSNIEGFMQQQSYSNFLQYSNLIGQGVSYAEQDSQGSMIGEGTARVDSVRKEGDDILVSLSNGKEISASQVIQIGEVNLDQEVEEDES